MISELKTIKCPICHTDLQDEDYPEDGFITNQDELYIHLKENHDTSTLAHYIAKPECYQE